MTSASTTVLIIGGSRGIGAATAKRFSSPRHRIFVTYRQRLNHAAQVCADVEAIGGEAHALQLDICSEDQVHALSELLRKEENRLDILVLAASGGLERDKPESYAELINVHAQNRMLDYLLPLMAVGGHIVFLTSHEAHFSDRVAPYGPYARVAETKRRGELVLKARSSDYVSRNIQFHVVSADIVTGTATAKLLEMSNPGLLDLRAGQVGRLPTVSDVADHIAEICSRASAPGVSTSYIWDPGDKYCREVSPVARTAQNTATQAE